MGEELLTRGIQPRNAETREKRHRKVEVAVGPGGNKFPLALRIGELVQFIRRRPGPVTEESVKKYERRG